MKIKIIEDIKDMLNFCVGRDIHQIHIEDTGETVKVEVEFIKF